MAFLEEQPTGSYYWYLPAAALLALLAAPQPSAGAGCCSRAVLLVEAICRNLK
eukprot:COSAG01_NODE_174_length_23022_cov_528.590978_17_plen_53_part_00